MKPSQNLLSWQVFVATCRTRSISQAAVLLDIDLPKASRLLSLKSSKAPTNYFTPNILRKSWSRLVVSVVHLDALAFPVAAT